MKGKNRVKYNNKITIIFIGSVFAAIIIISAVVCKMIVSHNGNGVDTPQKLIVKYMNYISSREYEQMYNMLNVQASGNIGLEDFVKRNSAIYEGLEIKDMRIEVLSYDKQQNAVTYKSSFATVAGKISFENKVLFLEGENGYEMIWDDSLIFPGLDAADKVRVSTTKADRGQILDRDGRVLAGKGTASSVGIVPGKLENREQSITQIAELLEIKPEDIDKKLSAGWVKDDSFVPLKIIPKIHEIEFISFDSNEENILEQERQKKLLNISGVMMSDTEIREYPLGEAAAHLIGYVQNVTAEDLEKHSGESYTENSVIGKNGMESLFERELKGQDGCRIYIVYADGNEKQELACIDVQHGQNIKLTIDSNLQTELFEQFKDDKSCSVAINPYTGEVLALVSTPSYNNNNFIMGLSNEQWNTLNEDENKPMYNRYRQVWCPGSTFKPIIAAIGLEAGAFNSEENFGNSGLSWQKDSSWGSYYVTTLHTYEPVTLENALIYSDNIYFAKAALKIGSAELEKRLTQLEFNKEMPFEITMQKSQYSNSERMETEIQLADSGYGQGQILINPLHMACIYSAFCNDGNIIKPSLIYKEEMVFDYWISNAFSNETVNIVLEAMKKVINNPNGTGYAAHRDDIVLAGKTGTAEIKSAKNDTSGTELGWFAVFTADNTAERPLLIISMTEDVKERGGSGYVVKKDRIVIDKWLQ